MLLLLAVTTALVPIRNSDFLQHLALGRLLTQGHLPLGTDPLTGPGEVVAAAQHTWLFDLTLYLLFAIGGAVVVLLVKAGLTVLIVEQQRRFAAVPDTPAAPAVLCLLLGLVALSPFLIVQSRLASLVLLSTTILLLGKYRASAENRPVPPVWTLPLLCLVWANVDNWFFLGPLCIGLFAAGTLLTERLSPTLADGSPRPKRGEQLMIVFGLSFAAMCLNPGLLALRFDLPPELGLNGCLSYVGDLPGYAYLSASPLSGDYFLTTTGWSVAGQCYFLLMLLAILSFPLLGARLPWDGLFIVVVLGLLSLYRVAAIPFFVVVTTPYLARNMQELLAIQTAADPDRKRDASGGVLLAGLLLVLAGIATYPGWLNSVPWTAHRVGLGWEPESDLRQMAERINELGVWYREKTGSDVPVWLNTSPAAAHYIAWYAPGQRAYIDQRLLLSSDAAKDYVAALQAPFRAATDRERPADPGAELPDRYAVYRKRKIRFLAFHQGDLIAALETRPSIERVTVEEVLRFTPVVRPLFGIIGGLRPEWTLVSLRGGTSVFAFRLNDEGHFDPLFNEQSERYTVRAFGTDPPRAPNTGTTQDAEPRAWIATLWNPEPLRNSDAEEVAQYRLLYETSKQRQAILIQVGWQVLWPRATAFTLSPPSMPAWQMGATSLIMDQFTLDSQLMARYIDPRRAIWPTVGQVYFSDKDLGSPTPVYLGIRAARRSLADNPLDAQAQLYLARLYYVLSHETRERYRNEKFGFLRQIRNYQVIAAAQAAVRLDPDLLGAHQVLASIYQELGLFDLFLYHLREQVRLEVARGPYPGEKADDAQKRLKARDELVQALQKEVDGRTQRYLVRSNKMKPFQQASMALIPEFGLANEARKVLKGLEEKELAEPVSGDRPGPRLWVDLMLLTGEVTPLRQFLDSENAPAAFGPHPQLGLPAYDWYRLCLGAVSGDYELADRAAAVLLKPFQNDAQAADGRTQTVRILSELLGELTGVLHSPPPPHTLAFGYGMERFLIVDALAEHLLRTRQIEADLFTLRGSMALELGDTAQSRAHFEKAIAIGTREKVRFAGEGIAQFGLELMNRAQELQRAP
jgi:hypothetical protein